MIFYAQGESREVWGRKGAVQGKSKLIFKIKNTKEEEAIEERQDKKRAELGNMAVGP